jgi:hypothetical protein
LIIRTDIAKEKPDYYSVSRLKTYSQCGEFYRRQYIEKDVIRSVSMSTLIGSLVHKALEEFYLDTYKSVEEAFESTCITTLSDVGVCGNEEAQVVRELLREYSDEMGVLYKRASSSYKGADAIRTKSGEVPSNPSMTSAWKKALESGGMAGKKSLIDTYIQDRNELITFSISEAFAEASFLCSNYYYPDIGTPIAIEMGLSVWNKEKGMLFNPVLMPVSFGAEEGLYLNGYIDLISLLPDGGIFICDHKTGKEDFTEISVSHNVQLLSYVYAYEELTGVRAKYIGINNVRLGKVVRAEVPNRDISNEILDTLFSGHKGITNEYFIKKRPESYSPCLAMYGEVCPYLGKCWPSAI